MPEWLGTASTCSYSYRNETPYIWNTHTNSWVILSEPSIFAQIHQESGREVAREGPFTLIKRGPVWSLQDVDLLYEEPPAPPSPPGKYLYLVIYDQPQGKPDHWALYLAHEDQTGIIYHVIEKEDTWRYAHVSEAFPFWAETFRVAYIIRKDCGVDIDHWLNVIAYSFPVPSSPDHCLRKENSQHWAWRILRELASRGMMSEALVRQVNDMIQDMPTPGSAS